MPEPTSLTQPPQGPFPSAAALLDASARWLADAEDFALGCECADPSLQIERWGQEIQPFPSGSA